MTSDKSILTSILRAERYFRTVSDTQFLFLEEYRDNTSSTKHSYVIEIQPLNDNLVSNDMGDELLTPIQDNVSIKHRTTLATEYHTDKLYLQLTGLDIANRLNKLSNMIRLNIIQPPGLMKDGSYHLPFQAFNFILDIKNKSELCTCSYPVKKLQNARYLGSKNTINSVKALQQILHFLQYDDEMEWNRFLDDGKFGKRTKTAVDSFIREINFLEPDYEKHILPSKIGRITPSIADALRKKCNDSTWQRPRYTELLDEKWTFSIKHGKNERLIRESQYFVRQLQHDLYTLGFLNSSQISSHPIFNSDIKSALVTFQKKAMIGMRFDYEKQNYVKNEIVTFTGSQNGILDNDTKQELKRWLTYYKIDYSDWKYLINFQAPKSVQKKLKRTWSPDWSIHRIEKGYGKINLDYYSVKIEKLPIVDDSEISPEKLLSHVRKNLNKFVDPKIALFTPYDKKQTQLWNSENYLSAIIHIDMDPGPKNILSGDGSVVVTEINSNYWIFSTLWTPADLDHPVSGNRQFGFVQNNDETYTFYTRGADRITNAITYIGSGGGAVAFESAHKLWQSFQERLVGFINNNSGHATKNIPYSVREDWELIRSKYQKNSWLD